MLCIITLAASSVRFSCRHTHYDSPAMLRRSKHTFRLNNKEARQCRHTCCQIVLASSLPLSRLAVLFCQLLCQKAINRGEKDRIELNKLTASEIPGRKMSGPLQTQRLSRFKGISFHPSNSSSRINRSFNSNMY